MDQASNLFSLLGSGPNDTPMDVLLDAIESDPSEPSALNVGENDLSRSSLPSLSAFLRDGGPSSSSHHHNHAEGSNSSSSSSGTVAGGSGSGSGVGGNAPGAGMSISSLLAASQQLASPETYSRGSRHGGGRRGGRAVPRTTPWVPTSSTLASFQHDDVDHDSSSLNDLNVVNSVTGLQGSFPPLPAIDRILDIDPLHPALRQLDQEHQQQQQQKQQQLQQQQQQQQQKQQHQHHQQEHQKQQQRRRQVQQQQRQNEATNPRAHSSRTQPRLPSNVKPWAGLKSEEDVRFRIQRSIERNAIGNGHQTGQPSDLTTVLCLHASVAQKSYGKEKRFLCPPPMARIDGAIGHYHDEHKPSLIMSVLSESGEPNAKEMAVQLDSQAKSYFRTLHVGGTTMPAKAKSFSLQLSVHSPVETTSSLDGAPNWVPDTPLSSAFASFNSADIAIISKPSKKTAKARNTTSCIFAGSTISFFNRINSQTVRTKYMAIDDGKLAARTSQWTAFSIHVLRRSEDSSSGGRGEKAKTSTSNSNGSLTVTYGSEILLTDVMTGVSSERLIVRKVEKGKVICNAVGPVSQLQKLALLRVSNGGPPEYLSAAAEPTEGEMGSEAGLEERSQAAETDLMQSIPATHPSLSTNGSIPSASNRKRKRDGDMINEDEQATTPMLIYQTPFNVIPPTTANDSEVHEVSDWMCWTVVGITSFSYSFIDTFGHIAEALPKNLTVTPFPTVTSPPEYHAASHRLSVSVANFYYNSHPNSTDPNDGRADAIAGGETLTPLQVWLGPIGPLRAHITSTGLYPNSTSDVLNGVDIQSLHSGETQWENPTRQLKKGDPASSIGDVLSGSMDDLGGGGLRGSADVSTTFNSIPTSYSNGQQNPGSLTQLSIELPGFEEMVFAASQRPSSSGSSTSPPSDPASLMDGTSSSALEAFLAASSTIIPSVTASPIAAPGNHVMDSHRVLSGHSRPIGLSAEENEESAMVLARSIAALTDSISVPSSSASVSMSMGAPITAANAPRYDIEQASGRSSSGKNGMGEEVDNSRHQALPNPEPNSVSCSLPGGVITSSFNSAGASNIMNTTANTTTTAPTTTDNNTTSMASFVPDQLASLPIIFVNPETGIGYITSRWVVAEPVMTAVQLPLPPSSKVDPPPSTLLSAGALATDIRVVAPVVGPEESSSSSSSSSLTKPASSSSLISAVDPALTETVELPVSLSNGGASSLHGSEVSGSGVGRLQQQQQQNRKGLSSSSTPPPTITGTVTGVNDVLNPQATSQGASSTGGLGPRWQIRIV